MSTDLLPGKTTQNGHRRTRTAVKSLRSGWVASTSRLKYAVVEATTTSTNLDRLLKSDLCKTYKTPLTQKVSACSTISSKT